MVPDFRDFLVSLEPQHPQLLLIKYSISTHEVLFIIVVRNLWSIFPHFSFLTDPMEISSFGDRKRLHTASQWLSSNAIR